jgi:hypothetical protein
VTMWNREERIDGVLLDLLLRSDVLVIPSTDWTAEELSVALATEGPEESAVLPAPATDQALAATPGIAADVIPAPEGCARRRADVAA